MLAELSVAVVIVLVCLLFHVAVILLMAEWLLRRREYLAEKGAAFQFSVVLIGLFAGILLLHVAETSIWAVFYHSSQLFSDFESSLYFSLSSYTTIGYGDLLLPRRWRLLGAIEGISGVLLCGISIAFLFAVMNAMLQIRMQQWRSPVEKSVQMPVKIRTHRIL